MYIYIWKKYVWRKGAHSNYRKSVHIFLNSVRKNAL